MRAFLLLVVCLMFCGCASIRQRHAVPPDKQARVEMPGLPGVRAWGDANLAGLSASVTSAFEQERRARVAEGLSPFPAHCDVLAISGGASRGAYGAGVLAGWSRAGTRPRFKIVTGISTGALMAPFAFLGPEYDAQLATLYTNVTSRDIFVFGVCDIFRMFYRDYVASTQPLKKLTDKCYDAAMLEKIAAEHRRGRRLYVATTCVDAQRPVIWDLGAIAASDHPRKAELFRAVIIASAAIPVAFPPVYLEVTADGQQYDEMHADGGLINQVFVYQAFWNAVDALRQAAPASVPTVRVFVLRNSQLDAEFQEVRPRLTPIAIRSLDTIIKANGNGDLFRIYTEATAHQAEFHLAAIPPGLKVEGDEQFDRVIMRQLYERGFADAAAGYPWLRTIGDAPAAPPARP